METNTINTNNQQSSLLDVLINWNNEVQKITNDSPNKSKTPLEKCIGVIDKEMNLIESRIDLELQKKTKTIKGKPYETNEIRFWKHLKDDEEGMIGFNIKYKGFHIYLEEDKLIKIPNNKELLLSVLGKMKEEIQKLNMNHSIFEQIQNIDDTIKRKKEERKEKERLEKELLEKQQSESVYNTNTEMFNEQYNGKYKTSINVWNTNIH